jgi:hydrogenase maturation protein HypF
LKQRRIINIEGIVQGVGFRPFVYRLAQELGICGWVLNDSRGVTIEAESTDTNLDSFLSRLHSELPPLASLSSLTQRTIPLQDEDSFAIRHSETRTEHNAQIAPDSYVCPDCLAELFDPNDRRYRYPFINCTNCGPRYSIITGIPYDRPNTTMAGFPICADCQGEYEDPTSRRFHAQPNACPTCGPQLQLLDSGGNSVDGKPLELATELILQGKIVAIKGLGGFHLAVDATNDAAVAELRRRKNRDEKPFALMDFDLGRIRAYAEVSADEERLLQGPERPIVLLQKRTEKPEPGISPQVAPHNNYLGVMLPSTPLHYLLLHELPTLVMTSGNLSDEPIAFEEQDARNRLSGIADYLLTHNRPIHIRTDDSIARMLADRPLLLRRSRGYVPRGLKLPQTQKNVLAVGAELKNCFCMTRKDRAFLSQHIGDLKNIETSNSFADGITHLQQILKWQPELIACDKHPDYMSTSYAEQFSELPLVKVQHHHAHMASCMAENGLDEPCIGVIFDGVGYGDDGCIWGGEFLLGDYTGYERVGHFAYLPLPGGDAAAKEPYRMAISALVHSYGKELPDLNFLREIPKGTLPLLLQMIAKGINSPLSSSCGRLFDAVSALIGVRNINGYEGQAALELEMTIATQENFSYPYRVTSDAGMLIFDPAVTIRAIVTDLQQSIPRGTISGRFHMTLAQMLTDVCRRIREQSGISKVVLSGGVFQNRFLSEAALKLLRSKGFEVFSHSLVPPNDGGIALGQAVIAGRVGQRSE